MLLEALDNNDPREYRHTLLTQKGRWTEGTCEWMLRSPLYSQWLNRPLQLLWITGPPGMGKTMLALYLIADRDEISRKNSLTLKLIYFFCSAYNGRNTGSYILWGLIYQLLDDSEDLFRHIRKPFARHKKALFRHERFETLWDVFENMIRDEMLESVTCILDGLNECRGDSLMPLLSKLRGLFSFNRTSHSENRQPRVKMIITSRKDPKVLEDILGEFPRLRLELTFQDDRTIDIESYIDSRMNELACSERKKPHLKELRQNIKRRLVECSGGTYLWVNFAINSLKSRICPELENAVNEFPEGLDAMYGRMLLSVSATKKDIVCRMLRWVVTAYRPLTPEELGTALSTPKAVGQDLGDAVADYVHSCFDLLVIIDQKLSEPLSRSVVPVHASWTDFLLHLNENPELRQFHMEPSENHRILAQRILDYSYEFLKEHPRIPITGHDEVRNYFAEVSNQPLLEYSCRNSLRHLNDSGVAFLEFSHPLLDAGSHLHQVWLRWQARICGDLWLSRDIGLVHLAALLGQLEIVRFCIETSHVDVRDQYQLTPLFYAVFSGCSSMVSYLLERGADPDAKDC
ncbi:uncharacterized protein EI97DRAFT_406490, partial [Westerdykella ornata]